MTTKERIIEQLERMDEVDLLALEKQLKEATPGNIDNEQRIKQQLEALDNVADMLSDAEEYTEFEKYARCRSMFGGQALDVELVRDETQLIGSENFEEEFRLLNELAAPVSEEDKAGFEENIKRRSL